MSINWRHSRQHCLLFPLILAIVISWLVALPAGLSAIEMRSAFEPIQAPSLKEACVHRMERLILSGELPAGRRLPAERQLAQQFEVSRPILHQALVELEAKGLVRIVPRKAVFVNDYRQAGSIAMLSSLLSFNHGKLDQPLLLSLIEFRKLLELETARLAALNRSQNDLKRLQAIYAEEIGSVRKNGERLTAMDFSFHLQIALASGNLLYPLILNSFKQVYTSFSGRFFEHYLKSDIIDQVYRYHERFIRCLEMQDELQATITMAEMLEHGARYLMEVSHANDTS